MVEFGAYYLFQKLKVQIADEKGKHFLIKSGHNRFTSANRTFLQRRYWDEIWSK